VTLHELVERVPVAMMTTIDRHDRLTSRPILALQRNGDERLWLLTRRDTAKLEEIANDARVNLAFVSRTGEFASVSGRASISCDSQILAQLWHPTYRAWFPQGRADPSIVLVCIAVERTDYWRTPWRAKRLVALLKALITGVPQETPRAPLVPWSFVLGAPVGPKDSEPRTD
jgi:general stress protein 26